MFNREFKMMNTNFDMTQNLTLIRRLNCVKKKFVNKAYVKQMWCNIKYEKKDLLLASTFLEEDQTQAQKSQITQIDKKSHTDFAKSKV